MVGCPRKSHGAQGSAEDKRDLPVTLGCARWLGASSVGLCKSWKRRGQRGGGLFRKQKSPL